MSGVQSFDYRGARADSIAGNVIVLHPDEVHDGRAGGAQGFRYRMIYIEPRLIAEALRGKANALPFLGSAVSSDPRLLSAIRAAFADLDRSYEPLERDKIVSRIADSLLVHDTSLAERGSRAVSTTAVDRARGFLDEHFFRTVASEELEAVTGLDRYSLARHFRRRLGTSPYRYLTMRRLGHAKAAIIAGYEVTCRVALALPAGEHYDRGYHPTVLAHADDRVGCGVQQGCEQRRGAFLGADRP